MLSETEKNIKKATERIGDIIAGARNAGRALTADEAKLVAGFRALMDEELRQQPSEGRRTLQNFGGDGRSHSGARVYDSFGEQLVSVMRAGIPGGQTDPRLYEIRATASGASETVPADGGFLVQQDFTSELLQNVFQTGILAQRCRRIQISSASNGLKINAVDESSRATGSRYGGVTGYWSEENALLTGTKPKFRQLNLDLKKLIGLCYATDELLQDATALEMIIRQAFTAEFGFQIDDAIINGTGAGQPLGILNAGCLVTQAKESGQKTATLVTENVFGMYRRLLPGSETSAAWLINRNIVPQLYTMSVAVGTGGVPVYMPAGGISGQPYSTLLGLPVIKIEQAATLGTVGDIILADLENGYIIAEKGGIQADMSIHIRFLYDESVFRFVLRLDGQPVLSSAITPYKGGATDTQSYFVVLATR